jgi:hypothetical protein
MRYYASGHAPGFIDNMQMVSAHCRVVLDAVGSVWSRQTIGLNAMAAQFGRIATILRSTVGRVCHRQIASATILLPAG